MQEENGRLQDENRKLASNQEILEQDLIQLKEKIEEMEQDSTELQAELDSVQKQKALLEQENHDLINALALNPEEARPAAANLSKEAVQDEATGKFRVTGAEQRHTRHSSTAMRASATEASDDVSPAKDRRQHGANGESSPGADATATHGVESPSAQHPAARSSRSLPSPNPPNATPGRSTESASAAVRWSTDATCVWISKTHAQPVHGVATGRDASTHNDVGVVSWDGVCSLWRVSEGEDAPVYAPVWSAKPGKGLYSVALGSVKGDTRTSVVGVSSMDATCYVLDGANGETCFVFRCV